MKVTDELVANVRSAIVEELELLADLEAQRAYERNVPIADVPAELFCGWFDDTYHPTSPAFIQAFSEDERRVLADFNERFDSESNEIGRDLPSLAELQALPAWEQVASSAQMALESIRALAA